MKDRVAFVDWLRLSAAIQMVVGHTVEAVLVDSARVGAAFEVWTWIRGLTAPAFLFASGVSFHLAARLDDAAGYEAQRARPELRRRRILRSMWLVVLGILLHVLDGPWIVDVLHCVGATLLLLDGLVTVVARRGRLTVVAVVLALGIVGLALPLEGRLAAVPAEGAMRFVLGWLRRGDGSMFPLFPWAAYVLAGLGVASFVLPRGARTDGPTIASRLFGAAVACLLASFLLDRLMSPPTAALWSSHPAVVTARLAAVLLGASVLAAITTRVTLPDWARALAGESLIIYVVHLLLLYAEGVGPGRVWPRVLPLPSALVLATFMVALSTLSALGWARLWPPLERRWMPWLRPASHRTNDATRGDEAR